MNVKVIKNNPLTKQQQDAINSQINTVVSAGAGSGKTTVLSKRFCKLVTENHYGVDEILTLTFTKKATVEMSSRIYQVLREQAPEEAANFYKANIKTLDSYCSSVAKAGAHFYGISPDFVQDDSIHDQIKQMALPFLLEHRNNEAIKQIISNKDIETISEELLVNPVVYHSTVTEPIDYDLCIKKQVKLVAEEFASLLKEMEKSISEISGLIENGDYQPDDKFIMQILPFFSGEQELPDAPVITEQTIENSEYEKAADYCIQIGKLAQLNLRAGAKSGAVVSIKDKIKHLREMCATLQCLVNYIYGYKTVVQIIPLLKEFQKKAIALKRATGRLSFADISSLATCTLRDYPEIRQIEKEKYKAIMIDEFQDNNQMQRDMLFMLTEKLDIHQKGVPQISDLCPDKLFFVGDEKQSIYKFRGADVSVFRKLSEDFAEGNLSMSSNHRSNPALIGCFNTFFGGYPYPGQKIKTDQVQPSIFYPEYENVSVPPYEPVYYKVTLSENAAEIVKNADEDLLNNIMAPKIHFAFYDKSQIAKDLQLVEEEAEIEWVARKTQEIIKGSPEKKGLKPGEIAILLRKTSIQPLIERTLLSHGIPYNSETITGLYGDGPVNDIISLLRICIYENDSLSYANVLRSPFVNLTVEEINAVIMANPLPFQLSGDRILTGPSLERYNHAKEFFVDLQNLCHTETLTSLISKIWYEAGYRYETMWNKTVKLYGKIYDILFELARKAECDSMSLAAFVDSLRVYQDPSQKLDGMDIPMETTEGVHILTIHKSKGLEFPVVFIVDTQAGSKVETNASPIYVSKEFGVTINTPPYPEFGKSNFFYMRTKEEESLKEAAELRRLLYVAITRAEREVYITNGKYTYTDDAVQKYNYGCKTTSFINLLKPVFNFYADEIKKLSSEKKESDIGPVPFTFEEIHPYNRGEYSADSTVRPNTQEEKLNLINRIKEQGFYNDENAIALEEVKSRYISPSHLHEKDEETGSVIPATENLEFKEINQLVEQSIPKSQIGTENPVPRFGYTDFGTIAHAYMEAAVKNEEVKIASKNLLGLENNEKKINTVKAICEKMKTMFESSDIGKEAIAAPFKKAEYDFRSRVCNKIIRGQIDLLFVSENGKCTIVDYKTNSEIKPEIYYNQLACYRQAVAQMQGIKSPSEIRCCLFYLRFGKCVDISNAVDSVNLEKAVLEIDEE